MLSTLLIVGLLGLQTITAKPAVLPDTPQGQHVDAYIKAFNSGNEKTFLAANDKVMAPEFLAKRPASDRSALFKRMRGDFDTLQIVRVVKATPQQIAFVAMLKDGAEGTFTFDFEDKTPFRISRLAIEVETREP